MLRDVKARLGIPVWKLWEGRPMETLGGRPMRQIGDRTAPQRMTCDRTPRGRTMERKMSWTPTPSHLIKQMSRKRGPRHKGVENTKWNDETSYPGSEKLMSFWAIFLVLHFASLICGNQLFGCYKGGTSECIYIYIYVYVCVLQS